TSAFAGNPLLISLERLAERGWIESSHLSRLPQNAGAIDYGEVNQRKLPLIIQAAGTFRDNAHENARKRFQHFCAENSWWLEDFVLFDALRERYARQCWKQWPRDLAYREPAALEKVRKELA